MDLWPKHPLIYEINTWVWLGELTRRHGRQVTLADLPSEELDFLTSIGADAVWLMGVWERSPAGIGISMQNEGLLQDFRRALPDFRVEDNAGSPYCVRRYVVDEHLGGPEGLAVARRALAQRGMRLILDFVPNHVAPDHPWVKEHPEYFIHGSADDLARNPSSFFESGGTVFACGKDPYFPAWPDVLQLNAFDPGLRAAALEIVASIADQCDGVRCDMAMLMLNNIFSRTWGVRAGQMPKTDYWRALIPAVRVEHKKFRFIAEAYWDLEWELQQQGFDFCYDKKLYDRMEHSGAEDIRLHLCADLSYQEGMVRFIENHDEPRAAASFPSHKGRAAAVAVLTLPGARLLHEGQQQGMKVRLPVFLARRPAEQIDRDLEVFYGKLLNAVNNDVFRNGQWKLCDRSGWPDNQSFMNLLAWCWRKDGERSLVVINYSGAPVQARIHIPWDDLAGRSWRLSDELSGSSYERSGDELLGAGLYVELGPWGWHLFSVNSL